MSTSAAKSPPLHVRWWRRAFWLRRDWRRIRTLDRHGPNIFAGFGGIGDELLATCAIHELNTRHGRPLTVMARYPELFGRNPDVGRVIAADPLLIETAKTWAPSSFGSAAAPNCTKSYVVFKASTIRW